MKQVNATGAVEGLTNDPSTVLLDIRNRTEIKEQGVPNLASTKKKAILLPFTQVAHLALFQAIPLRCVASWHSVSLKIHVANRDSPSYLL